MSNPDTMPAGMTIPTQRQADIDSMILRFDAPALPVRVKGHALRAVTKSWDTHGFYRWYCECDTSTAWLTPCATKRMAVEQHREHKRMVRRGHIHNMAVQISTRMTRVIVCHGCREVLPVEHDSTHLEVKRALRTHRRRVHAQVKERG